MIMNADILQLIAGETNRYTEQKIRRKPDPKWGGVTDVYSLGYDVSNVMLLYVFQTIPFTNIFLHVKSINE